MEPVYDIAQVLYPRNTQGRLPTLSPPFLTPDDAARFAHQLIGDKREVEYAGVILRNAQGRYLASRPVEMAGESFSPTQFISVDDKGQLKQPQGFRCYGFYYSRSHQLGGGETVPAKVSREQVITLANFFLPANIHSLLGMGRFADVHYLSGFNGSLLKVQARPTDDAKELFAFLSQVEEDDQPNGLQGFFQQVVDTLQVDVIESTEVWSGQTGRLSPGFFSLPLRALDTDDVIIQRPAYGPVLASEQLALEYALSLSAKTSSQHYCFILKNSTRDEFVVSQPVTEALDFVLVRAFTLDSERRPQLPANFTIVALYGCDSEYRDPAHLPHEQVSLFKNFLHPEALEKALSLAQGLGPADQIDALPLYIATRDGALLKYISKSHPVENMQFAKLPQSQGGGLKLLHNVLSGAEKFDVLVHALAYAGQLEVLRRSDVWGREGRVSYAWKPFEGFMRRTLSPVFVDMDDAARYAHEQIDRRVDFTYGGLVLKREDNLFVVTEPLAVNTETFDPQMVFPPELAAYIPYGCLIVAVYHTHRVRPLQLWRTANEERVNRNMFGAHELRAAILDRRGRVSYFSAQDGALLKYASTGSDSEKKLLARLSPPEAHPEQVRNNQTQNKLRANTLTPTQYVAQVARAGGLSVVVSSPLWGARGPVTPTWKPAPPPVVMSRLSLQPAYGPLFSQAQDAMRYVHARMGARATSQFGVILKREHSEQYLVTEPLPARSALLGQIFPRPFGSTDYSFAAGFILNAVYMATPKTPVALATDDVFADFIAPSDLIDLAVLSSMARDHSPWRSDYPQMFISTRNGALLSYRTENLNTLLVLDSASGPHTPVQVLLNNHTLRSPDYIRKVASGGHMDVLLTNNVWAAPGRVTSAWQPYAPAAALSNEPAPNVPALGPMFSHVDDAALYSHRKMVLPHAQKIVGAVFYSSADTLYVPLETQINGVPANAQDRIFLNALFERSSGSARPLPRLPSGYGPIAVHNAHPPIKPSIARPQQRNWVDHMFWPMDICYVVKNLERLEFSVNLAFLSGNDGALLKYVRRPGQAENDLCQSVVGYDYWENQYQDQDWVDKGLETKSQYIAKLLKAGELVVVSPGTNWAQVGWVTADWQATEPAKVKPELPWVRSPALIKKDEL